MDLLQLERVVATAPSAMTPVVRFWVDEREMRLIAWRGRWCLMAPLVVAGEWRAALPQLAQDAMGRILCDQTILTWDEPSQQLMLWEPLPQGCSLQERYGREQGRLGQPSTNHLAPPYSGQS